MRKNAVASACIIYPVAFIGAVCIIFVASAEVEFMKNPGDLVIGGLLPMRSAGANGKCDKVDFKALLAVEAMLFAIDKINSGEQIALKATLGYEVWDTCQGPRTSKLVKTTRNSSLAAVLGTLNDRDSMRTLFIDQMPFLGCNRSAFAGDYGFPNQKITLRSFALQAVSSDKSNFRALADVAAHFNWQYVTLIYTDDAAGKNARKTLLEETKLKLCIGNEYSVPTEDDDDEIDRIVNWLKIDPNSSVVVLLTRPDASTRLIAQASKKKVSKLVWLAGDTSWDNKQFVSANNSAAGRLFIVDSHASVLLFKTYLEGLGRSTIRNPWLLETVKRKTDGSQLPATTTVAPTASTAPVSSSVPLNHSGGATPMPRTPLPTPIPCADPTKPDCLIDEKKLKEVKKALILMAGEAACTLDSVFAVAHALAAREKTCRGSSVCLGDLNKFLNDVNFKNPITGHQVSFSAEGYLKQPEYKVNTYRQFDGDGPSRPEEKTNLERKELGTWKVSASGEPTLKIKEDKEIRRETGSCPKPCLPGDFRARKKNRSDTSCCWECAPCPEGSISPKQGAQECERCPEAFRPNLARTKCIRYLEDFVMWSDAVSLVLVFVMVTGMCFTVYVTIVLFRSRDTPVMRRAKNASLALLPVLLVLFLIPTPLLSKPTVTSCEGYRAFFTLALGVPLAVLIARSHTLDRVFQDDHGRGKACVGRLLVAGAVFVVHVIVVVVFAVYLPSGVTRFATPDPFTVYLECSIHTDIGLLAAVLYLLAVTVAVSVLSMEEPLSDDNDAEVKWVSLCMFIWAALSFWHVVFALGVPGEWKIYGMALVDLLFAANVLGCLYIPKWYIVVFKPERNQVTLSPWSAYLSTQNKVSERLSANRDGSPATPRRAGLASTAKESGAVRADMELQQLMDDTDV